MTTDLDVPRLELEEWLGELKTYQRNTLEVFLTDSTPEAAAEKWISSTGSKNIEPFGGTRDSKPFWERFRKEFHKFICDDSAYVEERKALLAKWSMAQIRSRIQRPLFICLGCPAELVDGVRLGPDFVESFLEIIFGVFPFEGPGDLVVERLKLEYSGFQGFKV